MPFLVHVATAVPPHRYRQEEVRRWARELFAPAYPDIERLLKAFDQSGIEYRHFCRPAEWYLRPRPFSERNRVYWEEAVELGARAAKRCLSEAGVDPEEVTDLWWISSTGIAAPSPDAALRRRLGLSSRVRRTPVWGLGCAGGAAGLSRAFAAAAADPAARVLLVAVELCSLTFMAGDRSKSNLIASVLFADGAAAALVLGDAAHRTWREKTGEGVGTWSWSGSHSTHWPDTLDMMGWDVGDDGWRVVFSRSIPDFLRHRGKEIGDPPGAGGESRVPVRHWAVHPGGAKVLAAYEEALGIGRDQLEPAYSILREYGNMSAPTVLFVLKRLWEGVEPGEGDGAELLALGPGFSAERVVMRWRSDSSSRG
ncbi:MAG: type III polyketide synthase [Alicyclobacillaceae bacterium]|nr:type III polyketide synthase [Alicyclobacillaceae bacterium]